MIYVQLNKPTGMNFQCKSCSVHTSGVRSKFNLSYSDLCEILENRGSVLTLKELDYCKVFTSNHNSVYGCSLFQQNAKCPVVPADLQLFYCFLRNPNTGCGDVLDAKAFYNCEIKDAGDPVIQLLSLMLPKCLTQSCNSLLIDLQCSPPLAMPPKPRTY